MKRAPSRIMSFWTNRRVLVTGGSGFLGRRVVAKLETRAPARIFVPRRQEYDLTQVENVERVYRDARPEIVIHLAGEVGGIGANRANPGSFFYNNLMMGAQMMEYGRRHEVEVRRPGNHLCISEVHACAFQRRGSLERISRRDKCPLRTRKENAARPGPGLPAAVWV